MRPTLYRIPPELLGTTFEWNFGDSEVLGLFYFVSGCVLGIETGERSS